MGQMDIPDHHVPQLTHLNVECKLLEKDRMAKQRDTHGYTAAVYAIILGNDKMVSEM